MQLSELRGRRVAVWGTGQEGVAAAAREPPDALLCDLGLPDMSGQDVVRAIRAREGGRRVFAVALTGYAQPQDREEALAAGFDAHVAKPPDIDALLALLGAAAARGAGPGTGSGA